MAIRPHCDACKKELEQFGALVIGPPDETNLVTKSHICRDCYARTIAPETGSAYQKMDNKRGVDFTGVTCVFFCHDGKGNVLLQKRSQNCRDEQGRWDCGGGSLEFGEGSFESAVRREVQEELGVDPLDVRFATVTNVVRDNNGTPTHWIAILHTVLIPRGQERIGEPDKIDDLQWFSVDALPDDRHSCFDRHFNLVKDVLSEHA